MSNGQSERGKYGNKLGDYERYLKQKEVEAQERDKSRLNELSEQYNIPREHLDKALFDFEMRAYKSFGLRRNQSSSFMKEPKLGRPLFRYRLRDQLPYERRSSFFRSGDEVERGKGDWLDEKEVMGTIKHNYEISRSRRDSTEDKIMNGFLQQDNKYKMGK